MNIGEIARRAQVSRSTVSYALSGKRPVSETTRRRIQQVIDELGYQPNASARALANGRTGTLGLVFPPAAGHHYTAMQLDFVGSLVDAAAAHEHDVLLSTGGMDSDSSLRRLLAERRVDGVILMEVRLADDRVEYLLDAAFPFVTIGRTDSPDRTCWVAVDHGALVTACVDHLADLGHRRIALVNRPDRLLRIGYESAQHGLDGFRAAIAARGLTGHHYPCDDDVSAGQACVEQILYDDPAVTALVTLNEAALGGLYRGLALAGRAVPRDFSIAGVALPHWAQVVTPQLTAADVPAAQLGRLAVDLLVARLADPTGPPRHHLLTPPVSLRASTGPAPLAPGS